MSCFRTVIFIKLNIIMGLSWFYFFLIYRINGGELFERVIDDDFILTERLCQLYMQQICEGVDFMHKSNILHLDMKVNLLIYACLCLAVYINYSIFVSLKMFYV